MKLNKYQERAAETDEVYPVGEYGGAYISYLTLGLNGEAGEVAEIIKKRIRARRISGKEDMICNELGDVLWYLARIASYFGLTLDEVARANLAKLAQRQKDGTIKER